MSSEHIYNRRKGWEEWQKKACQTCIYTRNFITAIKTQVWGTAQTYLMHIKMNTWWLTFFSVAPVPSKTIFCAKRGLPGSHGECWLLQIPGPRARSFLRSGPDKPKMKRYESKAAWPEQEPGLLGMHALYRAEGLYVSSLYFPTVHHISWPTPSTEGKMMNTVKEECPWL